MKESETLEFKKSTSELKEGIISIAAILNKHQKGELYFGIRKDGRIFGQDVTERTLREISEAISNSIEPKIYPRISEAILEGKKCVHVEFSGNDVPYYAYGRSYIRVADEDRKLSAKEIERLILKRNEGQWERGLSEKTLKDIDENSLKEFIAKANAVKRIDFKYTNVKSTLNKLGLIKENRLLKAAEVLFCDNNPFEVQAAVFAGEDKLTFLDISQLKGDLFELSKQSKLYLKEHMNWKAELTGEGRDEIPEVPIRAIEEAVVNSLCHRDYSNPKGNEIAFFKDRIEIYNPGKFPEEYEPEDFIKGAEKSILRNPLIANTLYLSKDIEKWGSGLKRIFAACKEAKVKVEFKRLKSGFSVVFYRKETREKTTQKIMEIVKGTPERELGERLGVKLGENEAKILGIIVENNYITSKELSKNIGISTTAIENNIAKLKKKGLLKRIGPDKGGHWEVV